MQSSPQKKIRRPIMRKEKNKKDMNTSKNKDSVDSLEDASPKSGNKSSPIENIQNEENSPETDPVIIEKANQDDDTINSVSPTQGHSTPTEAEDGNNTLNVDPQMNIDNSMDSAHYLGYSTDLDSQIKFYSPKNVEASINIDTQLNLDSPMNISPSMENNNGLSNNLASDSNQHNLEHSETPHDQGLTTAGDMSIIESGYLDRTTMQEYTAQGEVMGEKSHEDTVPMYSFSSAYARRGSRGSSNLMGDPFTEELLFKSIVAKKLIFIPLKEWEDDRSSRFASFITHAEPLIEDIHILSYRGNSLAKFILTYFTNIYSTIVNLSDVMSLKPDFVVSTVPDTFGSNTSDSIKQSMNSSYSSPRLQANNPSVTYTSTTTGGNITKKNVVSMNSLSSYFSELSEANALAEILEFGNTTGLEIKGICDFILNNLIGDKMQSLQAEYQEGTNMLLENIEQNKFTLITSAEKCLSNWSSFEIVFQESLKVDEKLNGHRKCCWLFERRYKKAAEEMIEAEKLFLKGLLTGLIKLQFMEKKRLEFVNSKYALFISTLGSFLEKTIHIAGLKHTKFIQEDEGKQRRKDNLFANEDMYISPITQLPTLAQPKFKYLNQKSTISDSLDNESVTHNSLPNEEYVSEILASLDWPENEDYPPYLYSEEFLNLLAPLYFNKMPEGSLLIKIGQVERQSGMKIFQKWVDCTIVLTWDRFLHVFKDISDLNPVYSFDLSIMETREFDSSKIKGNPKEFLIEIREVNRGIFTPSKNFIFAVPTRIETDDWLLRLRVACNTDDFVLASSQQYSHQIDGIDESNPFFTRSTPDTTHQLKNVSYSPTGQSSSINDPKNPSTDDYDFNTSYDYTSHPQSPSTHTYVPEPITQNPSFLHPYGTNYPQDSNNSNKWHKKIQAIPFAPTDHSRPPPFTSINPFMDDD